MGFPPLGVTQHPALRSPDFPPAASPRPATVQPSLALSQYSRLRGCGRRRVHIHSDSAYIVNCFLEGWWERWEKNGWRNSQKKAVANRDLWERILAETRRHDVVWHKVAGHSGDAMNERVDGLARDAIAG